MLNKSILKQGLIFLLLVFILTVFLYYPSTVGLADNSDFARTLHAFGMQSEEDNKYFSFQEKYIIKEPKSIFGYGIDLFRPVKNENVEYYSSQFLFLKGSLFLNSIYNKFTQTDRHYYNIGFQTILYILFYAIVLTFFLQKKWLSSMGADIVLKICLLLIFLDSGYLVYFNSFFGEATTVVFLLMAFVLLLAIEKGESNPIIYGILILSLWIFSGSKSANFPSTVILSIPIIYHFTNQKNRGKKIILLVLTLIMLLSAFNYVKKVPEWMDKVTTYQATFFGILKDNPNPKETLETLGLEKELLQLESTHGYLPKSYDIYGDEFEELFFQHVNKLDILKYYIMHPKFFIEKLDICAEGALPIRPTYLSNRRVPLGESDLIFEWRFNLWERFRKSFSGNALLIITSLFLLSFINIVFQFKKKEGAYKILFRLALLGSAIGQFILPIISNGEADLMKHMFLFNIHLDLLILILIYDNLEGLLKYRKSVPVFILIIALLITLPVSKLPETLTFGEINGEPIEWYILEEEGEWVKVIAKDSLLKSNFDDTSNFFASSTLNSILKQKKEEWFSKEEQTSIKKAVYPLILNYAELDQALIGDRPYYWFSGLKYAKQNYDRAYQMEFEGYLTLPSIADIEQLREISTRAVALKESYWVRTPYYSSQYLTRVVAPDYQIYHRRVNNELGVRPVMWIEKESYGNNY